MGVKLESRDIAVTHRLRKGKTDTHRPIIVRFTSRKARDDVLRAKKRLFAFCADRSSADRIYISEHLTTGVAKLYFEARRLVKEKKLFSTWTRNGLVNCKFTDSPAEKITIARSLADLSQLRAV